MSGGITDRTPTLAGIPNTATVHWSLKQMECYNELAEFLNINPKGNFPDELTIEEVYRNYQSLMGDNFFLVQRGQNIPEAKEIYEVLVALPGVRPRLYNNIVWLHLMYPEYDQALDIGKLHKYMDQALEKEINLNFYDAKACLYALEGDFVNAVKMEEAALLCPYDPFNKRTKAMQHLEMFKNGQVCRKVH